MSSNPQINSPSGRKDTPSTEHDTDDTREDFALLLSELGESVESYCKRRPGVVAGVLFGLGFFCGWKLRPW